MREQMEKRREELAAELRQGQEMLAEVEARRAELGQMLLRISGALQVLEELLAPDGPTTGAIRPAPASVTEPAA
ncbi:hypothetical protein I6A84_22780 [Frankia sp. CNm7]|uniref:Uncharacterized protein n=1 Tax=Frankia nepalensis TaxID=1836974 RepID=A0A937RM10_9ACTN|nr:hypothetical protein [Frankia nepalensis]MBL7495710.1 hypothetical protein [Frankia nepalensis]MBL7508984.1 hypothetical protein [Frankia nepalensis]MBL7520833.1 hypothetical protein [Frankia nepalensis]MBL7629784.1 hypothetical protein [Frankia nepalensis]